MLRIIVWLAQRAPRRLVRGLLYPITAYFLLTSRRSREMSKKYLRRAFGREPAWRDQWRHFFTFASCTLDRAFLLSSNLKSIHVEAQRGPGVLDVALSGRGCLLVVAHFGSTEVLRFAPVESGADAARAKHIKTTILLDRQHGRMLMQLFEQLNPEMALDIVDASVRGPQLVLKLKEALQAGRMVCVMADRVANDEGFVTVDFLGGRARFAESPWVLAAALRAPVILGFGVYRNETRYTAHFELFADRVDLPRENRKQALSQLAQRYADRLEHYVHLAPYNWFNFYDYWLSENLPPSPHAPAAY